MNFDFKLRQNAKHDNQTFKSNLSKLKKFLRCISGSTKLCRKTLISDQSSMLFTATLLINFEVEFGHFSILIILQAGAYSPEVQGV